MRDDVQELLARLVGAEATVGRVAERVAAPDAVPTAEFDKLTLSLLTQLVSVQAVSARAALVTAGVPLDLSGVPVSPGGVVPAEAVQLTGDVVVFSSSPGGPFVALVERAKEPFKGRLALPGGRVEAGEEVHDAALRELVEETGLVVDGLVSVGSYERPRRDPRPGRWVSFAYAAVVAGLPSLDAVDGGVVVARWVPLSEALAGELAFDHSQILADAAFLMAGELAAGSSDGGDEPGDPGSDFFSGPAAGPVSA